ncbi:mCG1031871 [Mus musculus]|jgi:protein tyrosine phosphatase type 4A|nr:mCG1031871 [Mus musculus]
MAQRNHPAPVEVTYKNMIFLITHNPTNATLNKFIEELKKYGVTTIVRVCEATYDTTLVKKEGICVLDSPFDDGVPPSNQIVDDWLSLVKIKFREEPGCCIAVHCVTGLGRAPVLVALALIVGSSFYIWTSTFRKCSSTSRIPMVIEITVVFNKTGVPRILSAKSSLSCSNKHPSQKCTVYISWTYRKYFYLSRT